MRWPLAATTLYAVTCLLPRDGTALTTLNVATEADLNTAINAINGSGDTSFVVNFTAAPSISLTASLPPLIPSASVQSVTFNGPATVDGQTSFSGFFVGASGPTTWSYNNLSLQNMLNKGGDGGVGQFGGGGGLGAGAGLFVGPGNTVTISNVNFTSNEARGGDGATFDGSISVAGGGGGGMLNALGGNGEDISDGAGGGGAGLAANGGTAFNETGGNGGGVNGGAGGTSNNNGTPGGFAGGGGGGGEITSGGGAGGAGGFYGGGGGAGSKAAAPVAFPPGGNGGFGGGGGGTGLGSQTVSGILGKGGDGGFGGGAAAGNITTSTSVFGGGDGGFVGVSPFNGGGGGGAGLGGALFIANGATVTVTNATFSGNAISGGAGGAGAHAGASGTALGIDVFLMSGGTLHFNLSAPLAIATNIESDQGAGGGSGGGIVIDSGDLTLSGTNTFTSALTINPGATLTVPSQTALGAATNTTTLQGGTLIASASFSITRPVQLGSAGGIFNTNGNTLSFDTTGQLSGPGMLTKNGAGTLVFNNATANSYAGDTIINAGTLQVTGGNIPTGSNALVNGILDIVTATTAPSIGNLTGTGTVTMGAQSITVIPNSTAIYNGQFIAASGTVTKGGGQSLTLAGNSPAFSGTTHLTSGTLVINGSHGDATSALLTDANTILKGGGIVGGPATVNGTLAAGNSIGILNFANGLTLGSTGIMAIDLNAIGQSDLNAIATALTLNPGATLQTVPVTGLYNKGTIYTIASFGSLSGAFANIIQPGSTFSVLYNANTIQLLVINTLNNLNLAAVANTANGKKTGQALDSVLSPSGDLLTVLQAISTLSPQQAAHALSVIQPSIVNAVPMTLEKNIFLVGSAFLKQLSKGRQDHCCISSLEIKHPEPGQKAEDLCCTTRVWIDLFEDYLNQDHWHEQTAFHSTTSGGVLGFDNAIHKNVIVGGGIGYTFSDMDWKGHRAKADLNSGYAGVFAKWYMPRAYVEGLVLAGYNHTKGSRHIEFGTIKRHAKHSNNGFSTDVHLGSGLIYTCNRWDLQPYSLFDYIFAHQDAFDERHAKSLNFQVHSKSYNLWRGELGLGLFRTEPFKSGNLVSYVKLGGAREVRTLGHHLGTKWHATHSHFAVTGMAPNHTLFTPGAGIAYQHCNSSVKCGLVYDGEFASNYWDQSIRLDLNVCF